MIRLVYFQRSTEYSGSQVIWHLHGCQFGNFLEQIGKQAKLINISQKNMMIVQYALSICREWLFLK